MDRGDPAAALKAAEEASHDYQSKGDKKGEGAALIMMANAAYQVGNFSEFQKCSSEALHAFQATKDKTGESAALVLVANACLAAGEYQEAVGSAEDGAILARESGSVKQMAFCKKAIAAASLALLQTKDNADPEVSAKALEAAQEAANAFRTVGAKGDLAAVLADLSLAYLLTGNTNMAIAKGRMAQRTFQADMNIQGEARSLLIIARAMQKEGGPTSLQSAMQNLDDAANLFASIGDQLGQAEAYGLMDEYASLTVQDRQDFTRRIMSRFNESSDGGAYAHHTLTSPQLKGSAAMFMPPSAQTTLGLGIVRFNGFMGRAASVVAPKGSSSGPVQNRFLVYNVSWN
jgi:tetratricopeptide (TPR) repeat protein